MIRTRLLLLTAHTSSEFQSIIVKNPHINIILLYVFLQHCDWIRCVRLERTSWEWVWAALDSSGFMFASDVIIEPDRAAWRHKDSQSGCSQWQGVQNSVITDCTRTQHTSAASSATESTAEVFVYYCTWVYPVAECIYFLLLLHTHFRGKYCRLICFYFLFVEFCSPWYKLISSHIINSPRQRTCHNIRIMYTFNTNIDYRVRKKIKIKMIISVILIENSKYTNNKQKTTALT